MNKFSSAYGYVGVYIFTRVLKSNKYCYSVLIYQADIYEVLSSFLG
ncbi:hypothetical protein [Paenibacillus sp. FSL H3-0286]